MTKTHEYTTVVVSTTIAEIEKSLGQILISFFSAKERKELENRHVRSTAGWLVLKQALCQLINQHELAQLAEQDIYLSRTASGRPCIEDLRIQSPDKEALLKQLYVSISHTRVTAYGMAVYQPE